MEFPELKNDLLLRALKGETVERPPVWMMRQAGRFLPDYRVLREKYTFFERCETPHLVSEITTMPIWQVGTDAYCSSMASKEASVAVFIFCTPFLRSVFAVVSPIL